MKKTNTANIFASVLTIAILPLTNLLSTGAIAATGADDPNRIPGGTITYVHEQEPPCLWGGWVQQAYLSRQVFDYLVSYSDDGQIKPWLATNWSESEDRKTITFRLRKDVVFTDGDKFNADAVVANYPAWEKGIGWHGFTYMTGFTKGDDFTVELHLSEPNPEIYNILANGHYGFQSPKSLAENTKEQKCLTPVGTGPWKIENWARGSGISFVRNDDYKMPIITVRLTRNGSNGNLCQTPQHGGAPLSVARPMLPINHRLFSGRTRNKNSRHCLSLRPADRRVYRSTLRVDLSPTSACARPSSTP
jgi:peptide/nickel transport system substrate-binding protein